MAIDLLPKGTIETQSRALAWALAEDGKVCQQCLGLLSVGGVKPSGEPAVAAGSPRAGQPASRGPPLPRLGLLAL